MIGRRTKKTASVLRFQWCYALLNLVLLVLIVAIACLVHDGFIRPFIGDVLITIWIYLLLHTWLLISVKPLACGVLVFCFSIEIAQYCHLVKHLGLEHYAVAKIIIGTTFDPMDLLAYGWGWLIIVGTEYAISRANKKAA